jgi:hypothetical protein
MTGALSQSLRRRGSWPQARLRWGRYTAPTAAVGLEHQSKTPRGVLHHSRTERQRP